MDSLAASFLTFRNCIVRGKRKENYCEKLTAALSFSCARTACKYGGKSIAFRVNEGSTNFWLSLLVEFEDGEGDLGSMQIKQVTNQRILPCSDSDLSLARFGAFFPLFPLPSGTQNSEWKRRGYLLPLTTFSAT